MNIYKVTAFLKPMQAHVQMDFSKFLSTPSIDIDYIKDFSIQAPKGLLAELQRHYLMYLSNYFPLAFCDPQKLDQPLPFSELTPEQVHAIKSYGNRKGIPISNSQISVEHILLLSKELGILRDIFSNNFVISAKEPKDMHSITNALLGEEIERGLLYTSDRMISIDPKILTLLFQGTRYGVFQLLAPENLPLDLLEHLKLEGEEHYFYKTTDELITYIAQYSKFILSKTNKSGYCLVPIDYSYIREAKRPLYRSILERDTLMIDLHGNVQKPITEKNIIHFQLQSDRKAFSSLQKILRESSSKYPLFKRWFSMGNLEMLDLVSHDDSVIGVMSRTEVYNKKLNNFRVINAFLVNSKGELWIPTRQPSKRLFPLSLDASVGGHVMSRESYFDAFCRETVEEINLNPRNYPHKLLAKLTPQEHSVSAFMEVYAVTYDGPVHFNRDDFASGQWMSPKHLKKILENGAPAKGDLKFILEACFPDV